MQNGKRRGWKVVIWAKRSIILKHTTCAFFTCCSRSGADTTEHKYERHGRAVTTQDRVLTNTQPNVIMYLMSIPAHPGNNTCFPGNASFPYYCGQGAFSSGK